MPKVEQVDRDAAAAYLALIRDSRWSQDGVLSGGCDNVSLVQAFARHRIEAEKLAHAAGMERAAAIAAGEKWGERHLAASDADGNAGPSHYNQACDDIATAIRQAIGADNA